MYPLKFNPIFKSMIWGGDKLRQYKAIDTDQKNIGELIKEYGHELLGRHGSVGSRPAFRQDRDVVCRVGR